MLKSGSDHHLWGSLSRIPNQNNFGRKFFKFSKMRDFAMRPGGIGKMLENRRSAYRRGSPFPINCRPTHRKDIARKVDSGERDQNEKQANSDKKLGLKKMASTMSFTATNNTTVDAKQSSDSSPFTSFVFFEEETVTTQSIESDSGCNFLTNF